MHRNYISSFCCLANGFPIPIPLMRCPNPGTSAQNFFISLSLSLNGKQTVCELENGPVESSWIYPFKTWWIFPSFFVRLPCPKRLPGPPGLPDRNPSSARHPARCSPRSRRDLSVEAVAISNGFFLRRNGGCFLSSNKSRRAKPTIRFAPIPGLKFAPNSRCKAKLSKYGGLPWPTLRRICVALFGT